MPGRAFTAFETLLASAVLAIIALSVSSALMAGRQQTTNAQNAMYASFLAQQLLEEITRLPYRDPNGASNFGPEAGETSRSLFDNQDDYHGYADGDGTTITTIADLAGNAYPREYQSFSRSVTMTATSVTPPGWGRTISGLTVTITIQRGAQTCATLEQFLTP